jgi:hypothetical protein
MPLNYAENGWHGTGYRTDATRLIHRKVAARDPSAYLHKSAK